MLSPGLQKKRWNLPVDLERIEDFTIRTENIEYRDEASNGLLLPKRGSKGVVIIDVSAPNSAPLESVQLGGRFLRLDDLAPEKLTAETRETILGKQASSTASLSWALAPEGPWNEVWRFEPPSKWLDQEPVDRLLLWPEVDHQIDDLPSEPSHIYVRYVIDGMAVDDIRLAAYTTLPSRETTLVVTHNWSSNGRRISQSHEFAEPGTPAEYTIDTGAFSTIENHSIIFECRSAGE